MAGETGSDVDDFISTSVSVVFVLVGEFIETAFVVTLVGEIGRGDCNVPLSRAGKIFVKVLLADRCDDDDGAE